jgi:hypothetical protein
MRVDAVLDSSGREMICAPAAIGTAGVDAEEEDDGDTVGGVIDCRGAGRFAEAILPSSI